MTAAQQVAAIDKLLAQKHGDIQKPSPLAGCGCYFVVLGHYYGFDGRVTVAVAGAETTYATDPAAGEDIKSKFNAFGIGPHYDLGSSWPEGINRASVLLGRIIRSGPETVDRLGMYWVNGPRSTKPAPENWIRTVKAVVKQLGGDPEGSQRTARL